jgi:hypothetical protein
VIEINTRRLLLLASVIAVLMIADGLGRLLPPLDRNSDGAEIADAGRLDEDVTFVSGRPFSIRAARDILKNAIPQIVLGFWSCLCVLTAASLIWGLKLVECRLCGGAGRLSLEAQPPEEPGFTVDTDCVYCEGLGRLGLLDRWWTH